jgi:hypothetical protein
VYHNSSAVFAGIALPKDVSPDAIRIYSVDFHSLPVLLTAALPDDLRDIPLHYQILR